MSGLSIFNRFHLNFAKLLIPIVVFGILFGNSRSNSDVLQTDYESSEEPVEKISFCDENLIKKRESSKR